MSRTRVKICGITTAEGARVAAEAGADAVGFVFARQSVRSITPAKAWEIVSGLPPMVTSVGVFVNASLDAFCDIEEECPTTFSQLHGNEDEALVRQCGPGVIRGIRYEAGTIRDEIERWAAVEEVDAILIDGSAGGQGTSFDWAGLATAVRSVGPGKPIFLAGGLTPENVREAVRAVRPYAVDVSSGVERAPGVKDEKMIEAFCRAVMEADQG